MKRFAIIVAGGTGNRMNSIIPKQFVPIGGKPVLMRTIEQFYKTDSTIKIILVLPKEQIQYWQELQTEYGFEVPVLVTEGGSTRFYSVKNGLSLINEEGLIAVHDGVRPFVTSTTIQNGYDAAEKHQAAIPVVDVIDSIRLVSGSENKALNRADYKLVQTPQVFQSELLMRGYEQVFSENFTDDASVVESLGNSIFLFDGNRENIKLTTPFDMKIAEVMVRN